MISVLLVISLDINFAANFYLFAVVFHLLKNCTLILFLNDPWFVYGSETGVIRGLGRQQITNVELF